jgi:hypothetical protein
VFSRISKLFAFQVLAFLPCRKLKKEKDGKQNT